MWENIPLEFHGQKLESSTEFRIWQMSRWARSCITPLRIACELCAAVAHYSYSVPVLSESPPKPENDKCYIHLVLCEQWNNDPSTTTDLIDYKVQ